MTKQRYLGKYAPALLVRPEDWGYTKKDWSIRNKGDTPMHTPIKMPVFTGEFMFIALLIRLAVSITIFAFSWLVLPEIFELNEPQFFSVQTIIGILLIVWNVFYCRKLRCENSKCSK